MILSTANSKEYARVDAVLFEAYCQRIEASGDGHVVGVVGVVVYPGVAVEYGVP